MATVQTFGTILGLLIALFGPILIAVVSERSSHPPNRLGSLLVAQAALLAVVAIVLLIIFF